MNSEQKIVALEAKVFAYKLILCEVVKMRICRERYVNSPPGQQRWEWLERIKLTEKTVDRLLLEAEITMADKIHPKPKGDEEKNEV